MEIIATAKLYLHWPMRNKWNHIGVVSIRARLCRNNLVPALTPTCFNFASFVNFEDEWSETHQ